MQELNVSVWAPKSTSFRLEQARSCRIQMVDLSTAHIQAEVDPVHEYSGTEKPAIFMHHFHLFIFVQEIVPLDFRGSRITQPGLADKPCFI